MTELPGSVYAIVGILVVTNIATIGTLIVFIFKCGQFVSDTKHGIEAAKNEGVDAKASAVRAHKRIDKHEEVYHAP